MDSTYVQGLREAKAQLDEGVLTQEEFNKDKNELVKEREERRAAAAATSREERRAEAAAAASSELAGLVKLVQPGQPHPPAELPNINTALADGPCPPCPPHSRKPSRDASPVSSHIGGCRKTFSFAVSESSKIGEAGKEV
jgi:hypothetical protein